MDFSPKTNSDSFIKGALTNIFLQFLAYFLTQWLGGPFIFITDETGQNIALWLVFGAFVILAASLIFAFFKSGYTSSKIT